MRDIVRKHFKWSLMAIDDPTSHRLVSLPRELGIGCLTAIDQTHTKGRVRVMLRDGTTTDHVFALPLQRAFLAPQTRVTVETETGAQPGRVVDYLVNETEQIRYSIKIRDGSNQIFPESAIGIRPWTEAVDPLSLLHQRLFETPWFFDRRRRFLESMAGLRHAAKGMTALLSAGIEHAPHQIAAVRRILTDPVQRYLLADEVGLGKTIEAGLVLRQHRIDDPGTRALIAVPAHLIEQWDAELTGKLSLDQFDNAYQLCAHEDLCTIEDPPDLLIVDEAHRLFHSDTEDAPFDTRAFLDLAHRTPSLLLLSATPPTQDPPRYHAMLHALDPNAFPADGLEAFQQKLDRQGEVAKLLLRLSPDLDDVALSALPRAITRYLGDDPKARSLAEEAAMLAELPPEHRAVGITALSETVARYYRLQRRIIRTRRKDVPDWMTRLRGTGQDAGALAIQGQAIPVETIEDWRYGLDDMSLAPDEAAARYAGLLEAAGAGDPALLHWLNTPCPNEGAACLDARQDMIETLRAEGEDISETRAIAAAQALLDSLGNTPLVVFASDRARAERFHAAWTALDDKAPAFLLVEGREADAFDDPIEDFGEAKGAALLVADRTGEEGLNLAFAGGILHLDLPFSPARLEQRIGRLDRFGRRLGTLQQHVLIPETGLDSPWAAWLAVLDQGLGLFDHSISDVLTLAGRVRDEALQVLTERGASTLLERIPDIRVEIDAERQRQEDQAVVDRMAERETGTHELIKAIEEAETDDTALEATTDGWLLEALKLRKTGDAETFTLSRERNTMIPEHPWWEGIDETMPLTWQRRIAVNRASTALMRPGLPLVDRLERFSRWDDRGTACILHRRVHSWKRPPWAGFVLDVRLEADIAPAHPLYPSVLERALERRAYEYLEPISRRLMVDLEGKDVSGDPLLRALLSQPFLKRGAKPHPTYEDCNLGHTDHLRRVDAVIGLDRLSDRCSNALARAADAMPSQPELRAKLDDALVQLEDDLRRYQAYDVPGDQGGTLAALERLRPALEYPRVRVEGLCCILISRETAERYGDA